jgi:hypothetical protein
MFRGLDDRLSAGCAQFRFFRAGAVDETPAPCFLAAAHLFRCAAAILERAAADILRRFLGARVLLSVALGLNKFRSSPICVSSRFFCCSKPAIAAATISVLSFVGMLVLYHRFSCFAELIICFAELIIVLPEDTGRRRRNATSAA